MSLAELLGARVPDVLSPGESFVAVGYFGRGACDVAVARVTREPASVRLALERRNDAPDLICPSILLRDSVLARVEPPYPLPFSVRLARSGRPDSVVIIRQR